MFDKKISFQTNKYGKNYQNAKVFVFFVYIGLIILTVFFCEN